MTLREAAQQALEAMSSFESGTGGLYEGEFSAEIAALRAALAEPQPCNKSCAPGYCYCECPHGVTDGNCKECYEAKTTVPSDCTDSRLPVAWYHVPHPGNGISPVVSMFQQREPSLYGAVVPLYIAPPQQALTIERLRDALVASRIIPPAAVEDPDEYDDGVTLFRIEALHRRITEK